MTIPFDPRRFVSLRTAHVAPLLALASAGCSSDYAIGDLSERDLLAENEPTASATAASSPIDFQLDPLLGSPDVTMDLRTYIPFNTGVGDLDGDGYDELAASGFDYATLVGYVHLRYGGPRPVDAEGEFAFAESGVRLTFEPNPPLITSIGPVGDIDGDGFGDMLVTTAVCEDIYPKEGGYLLYGGPERLTGVERIGDVTTFLKPNLVKLATESCGMGSQLGLGDIDGDGLDDFMLVNNVQSNVNDLALVGEPTLGTGYLFYGREERLEGGTSWLDADATLTANQYFDVFPLGDITGDGRADVMLGTDFEDTYLAPGHSERLSGVVDVATAFVLIDAPGEPSPDCPGGICRLLPLTRAGDVDGDGIDDVLASSTGSDAHLFYGAPGLFEDGVVDFATASATFADELAILHTQNLLVPAGDRDGDGDADLLSYFYSEDLVHTDVAFVSGSSARLSGSQTLPIQAAIAARPTGMAFGRFIPAQNFALEQPERVLMSVNSVGDLDGDGASELVTTSMIVTEVSSEGISYAPGLQQTHIHYGTPGGASASPVR